MYNKEFFYRRTGPFKLFSYYLPRRIYIFLRHDWFDGMSVTLRLFKLSKFVVELLKTHHCTMYTVTYIVCAFRLAWKNAYT